MNYHNHPLVGIGSNVDLFTAIHAAIEKLEKQTIKVRAKWRDTKRTPCKEEAAAHRRTGCRTGGARKRAACKPHQSPRAA